ncbi:MAG: aminopeptidase P family protein [Acidobacteria bacterium]|nr:aminopeptidase P family protein [Acidobacteriota bacterium]
MKLFTTFFLILTFTLAALPAGPTSIIVTPKAPKFTDAERHAELARRRAAVVAKMADKSILVMFSAEPRLYTNDVDYVYRQENNLFYLTGLKQDGATLVITKDGGAVTETLFIPKRVPLREAWEGRMYSREQVSQISGMKTIIDASEQPAFLAALRSKAAFTAKEGGTSIPTSAESIYMLLPQGENDENGRREFHVEDHFAKENKTLKFVNAQPIFGELRLIKSPFELKILQHAVDISTEAHMRAMATVGRADWEYEVHAELEYTFRRRNADFWGYPSIVGCGPNATTLHYVESQSPVKKGEVMLIDAAAEYEHYTADITRTFPVNGKFTKEQAEIYQIVFDAQEAVAKATKPGVTWQQLSAIARNTINDGLFKLGLVVDKNSRQAGIWSLHGLGHWLGMNVHDVGSYQGPLKAGGVYTNEPGIYIREDALDNLPDTPENKAFIAKVRPVYEKYKNIGVRIEDDMLITETGVEWMSGKLPRTIADIEAFMAVAPKQVPLAERIKNNPAPILFEQSLAAR